jgi:integration host factor subunit beta
LVILHVIDRSARRSNFSHRSRLRAARARTRSNGVTRSDLIDTISEKCRIDRPTAERVVRTVFEAMTDALRRGDGIELRGLGSFILRSYKPYLGRNPRNGSPVEVKPKRLPHFKPGKPMRARIAGTRRAAKPAADTPSGESAAG